MARDKRDAVTWITKGKSSGLRIGSRAIPHRLTSEERRLFEIALERGVLRSLGSCRDNLANAYLLYCQSTGTPFIHADLRASKVLIEMDISHLVDFQVVASSLSSELPLQPGQLEKFRNTGALSIQRGERNEAIQLAKAIHESLGACLA